MGLYCLWWGQQCRAISAEECAADPSKQGSAFAAMLEEDGSVVSWGSFAEYGGEQQCRERSAEECAAHSSNW